MLAMVLRAKMIVAKNTIMDREELDGLEGASVHIYLPTCLSRVTQLRQKTRDGCPRFMVARRSACCLGCANVTLSLPSGATRRDIDQVYWYRTLGVEHALDEAEMYAMFHCCEKVK